MNTSVGLWRCLTACGNNPAMEIDPDAPRGLVWHGSRLRPEGTRVDGRPVCPVCGGPVGPSAVNRRDLRTSDAGHNRLQLEIMEPAS